MSDQCTCPPCPTEDCRSVDEMCTDPDCQWGKYAGCRVHGPAIWERMKQENWSPFGTHIDIIRAELEFTGNQNGLPAWERPVLKDEWFKQIDEALGGLYVPGLESSTPVVIALQKVFAKELYGRLIEQRNFWSEKFTQQSAEFQEEHVELQKQLDAKTFLKDAAEALLLKREMEINKLNEELDENVGIMQVLRRRAEEADNS